MADLERLSITIEKSLLEKMNTLMEDSRFTNRSEFIRDLLRSRLVEEQWKSDEEALGTVTVIYNHDQRELSQKLTKVQHHHHDAVMATTHVHLNHDTCAEMIMVRGRASQIKALADEIRKQRGVLHATVSMSSTGKQLG